MLRRLLRGPVGWLASAVGFVVANGVTDYPDARWLDPLAEASTQVRLDVQHNGETPAGTTIDTLPYFVATVPNAWPRTTPDGSATYQVHRDPANPTQLFDVKGDAAAHEDWRYDDDWISLWFDNTNTTTGSEPWYLRDGRWLKRLAVIGQRISIRPNARIVLTPDGRYKATQAWGHTIGVLRHWQAVDCGGDVGVAPVLVSLFEPDNAAGKGYREENWYAKGWGRVRFQSFRRSDGALVADVWFNRRGGTVVPPAPPFRPAEAPPVPPKITIASWGPRIGVAPLAVTCVWRREPDAGPIHRVRWQQRPVGSSIWRDDTSDAAGNPAGDPDHTFHFAAVGRYEIRAIGAGPGGESPTLAQRVVEVMEPADRADSADRDRAM